MSVKFLGCCSFVTVNSSISEFVFVLFLFCFYICRLTIVFSVLLNILGLALFFLLDVDMNFYTSKYCIYSLVV